MRKLSVLCVFIIAALISCQKEIDWGLNTNTPEQLLIKILQKTGADSAQYVFTYNTAKQLIQEKLTGVSGGQTLDNDLKIYRNSSGIIDRTVQVSPALVAVGMDSIVTKYNYNTTTSKYTSAVFTMSIGGFGITDSAVFTYDASGKITQDEHYQTMVGLPAAVLSLRTIYSYSADGSTLTSIQQSAATTIGGPLTPLATQNFTYDSRKAPLVIKNEAIVLLRTGWYSTRNVTKATMSNTADPSADFALDITYKYNSSNKPDSSFATRTPGGTVSASKYFYQ